MPKQTKQQRNKRTANALRKNLPAKGTKGETVVKNSLLKRAIKNLEK